MANNDEEEVRSGPGVMGFLLPIATAVVALGVGALAGAAGAWMIKPAEIVEKVVPRELTQAELEAACSPMVDKVVAELSQAQDKVTTLLDDVKTKEARVKELEAKAAKGAAAGAELRKELESARAELETVKEQLRVAIEEKEAILVELKKTVRALDVQKEETTVAKEDALDKGWDGFISQAQLDVCEKGGRKKMGKCREAVEAKLTPGVRSKYTHCLRSGQEAPSLAELMKDETLPEFAQYLDQEDKITKDWYIRLCDPSLPEAKGFASDEVLSAPLEVPTPPAEDELQINP